MSLDLSTIKFQVNTDDLVEAVKKIETLGKSVEGLATSLGKLDKATAEANKEQSQANLNNAKTEAINIKNAKTLRDSAAASDELTDATRKRQSVEERQAAITRLMAEGNSRGQASILATAEALGEATEKTNEYLKAQRAMSSNNPFDRSLGAATVFANELKVATVASDLYNKDLGFTKNQLQELGREHVRLTEQFKVQGKSLSGLDAEFNKIVQSAQQVTQAENAMAASMKNGQKATVDAGKANAYIESELQKVRFALQANNEELNRSTANSLVRFENALKKSGLTLDQQKVKIDEYRKAQVELQKTTSANQTDYITRAVGPQITDIVVGLSTGQSPLTVMMQQGGQLRDQFGMMGIAAKDMGDVMRNAMKGMAQSVFDTGKAIGSMLVGGIYDAGKAVVDFGMNLTKMNSLLEGGKRLLAAQGEEGFKYIGMLNRAGAVLTGVFAVGIAAGALVVVALGIAFAQVTKAQDDLTKSLVSSGAQLGLSNVDAIALAESLRGVGSTSVEILAAFTQISESGKISRESLVAVAEAALLLENAGGKAASKTIEMFTKLADKPMETLSEYAQKTGLVDQAEMQRIDTLVKLGQEITATEESTKILTKATENEAAIMVASLSDVSRLWLTVKAGTSEAWRAVQEFASSAEVMSVVKVVLQTVAVLATEVWYGIKGIGESLGGLGAIAAAVMTDIKNLDTNFTASKGMLGMIEEQDKARASSYNDSIARIMQEGKYSREELNKTAALAATGRKVTADAEKDRVAHELAMKPWREQEQKSLADNLTKQEFIKQAIDKTNKALTEGKTLRAEEIAQITKLAGADWDKSNKPKKTKLTDEQKEINKAREEYIDIQNKAIGVNKDFNNQLERQNLLFTKGEISEEAYIKVVQDLIKTQPFYIKGLADEEKAQNAAKKAAEDHMKLVEEFTKIKAKFIATTLTNQTDITNETASLKLRNELLGKTEEEQKKINLQYKAQGDITKINLKYDKQRLDLQQEYLKLQADGFDVDYDTWNAQINESVRQQGEEAKLVWAGVAMSAAENLQKEFEAIKSTITDTIVTALFDGGKAGSKKLRDQVVAAFRNKITVVIDAVVNTALSGGMNALGIGKGAGGLMSGVGTAANLYSMGSATLGGLASGATSLGGILSATGASVGTAATYGTAIGSAQTAMLAAQEAGMGLAGAANGITAALGSIPVWGWLAMGGLALAGALQGGETRSGGQYSSTATTGASLVSGPSGGEINGAVARQMLDITQMGINAMFKAVGSTATIAAFTAGLESSEAGKGFAYAGGTLSTGAKFGDLNSYMNNRGNKTPEEAMAAYKTELLQATLGALKAATDVPRTIQNIIGDTDIGTLTESAATALMSQISTIITAVDSLKSSLLVLPFEYLKSLSFDAAAGLIAAAGGLETLSNNLSGFYDNFYTEAEKTANLTKNTSDAFAAMNIEMPKIDENTRNWYRSEVERLGAMDLSIESNAQAYASVLGLQGAVNTLAPAFDSVGTSVSDLAESARQAAATMVSSWASIMQARGVASSDVTRYTAQASIDAAFTQYKTTDKAGIKSAEQFSTITQADFKNYTSEQQVLIATILTGFKSIADSNVLVETQVQDSYTQVKQASENTAGVVKDAFESIRENLRGTSASLEVDLLNVQGRTAEAKAAQVAIDTASFSTDEASMALYSYNQSLKDQISHFSTLKGLQEEYDNLTLSQAEKRNKVLNALNKQDPTGSLGGKQTEIWNKQDSELVKQSVFDFNRAILEASGNSSGLEAFDKAVTDAALIAKGWTSEQIKAVDAAKAKTTADTKTLEDNKALAQVQSDYNRALLEAQGNSSGLEAFDKAISDAALIAKGWTSEQIKAVDAAKAKTSADAKSTENAITRNSWRDKLDVLMGARTQEQMDTQNALAGVTDLATVELIMLVLGLERTQAAAKKLAEENERVAQVTSEFNRSLLEAQGNTSGLAEFDKAISDAALIAKGWTQAQIDAIDTARAKTLADTKAIEDNKALAQVQSNYNKALLEAQGDTKGLEVFNKAISDAALITEGWSLDQIKNIDAARAKTLFDAKTIEDNKALAQVTSDFSRALLEAQGDTAGLAAFDRKLSDAALVASGWTQVQVDAVNAARASAEAIQVQSNYSRALLEAQGDTSGLAAFDRKLSDAALVASGWTESMVLAVNEARTKVEADLKLKEQTQTQSDFNRALLEASNDTSSLAEFDRKLSDAALVAAGWTQVQVDAVNAARASTEAKAKADTLVQVQSDYSRALLEATGDNSGLAEFDQKLSDAALVASGWTQVQVDAVNTAKAKTAADTKTIEDNKALAQVQSDYNRALLEATGDNSGLAAFDKAVSDAALVAAGWTAAQVKKVNEAKDELRVKTGIGTWQERLNSLSEEGIILNRLIQLQRDLSAASSDTEKSLIRQVYAQEDLKSATDKATAASKEAANSAFSALQRAVDSQRQIYEKAKENATELVSVLKGLFDLLRSNIKELYSEVDSTAKMQAQAGLAFIKSSLQKAKTTGVLPETELLSEAINAVRNDTKLYGTRLEQEFAKLTLANDLSELEKLTKGQLTDAEKALANAEAQLAALNNVLMLAQKQLDAANGINTSVISVADAVNNLAIALGVDASTIMGGGSVSNPYGTYSIGGRDYTGNQSESINLKKAKEITAGLTDPNDIAYALLKKTGTWGDTILYNDLRESGAKGAARATSEKMAEDIAKKYGSIENLKEKAAALPENYGSNPYQDIIDNLNNQNEIAGLPAYEIGTNYVPNDGLAFLHEGEAVIPKAYNPAVSDLNNSSSLVEELKSLRIEVQMLRIEARATAINTSKLNNNFERSIVPTTEGDALLVKTAV
jgi:hypothetical protein